MRVYRMGTRERADAPVRVDRSGWPVITRCHSRFSARLESSQTMIPRRSSDLVDLRRAFCVTYQVLRRAVAGASRSGHPLADELQRPVDVLGQTRPPKGQGQVELVKPSSRK
jgi:hypothetical protein